jgi:ribulose-phosphate 3-epimerase
MPKLKVMPSILAADLGNLRHDLLRCQAAEADGVHIDVMDGHFVPNLAFTPATVALANKTIDLELNVHLMIKNPDEMAAAFLEAGADTLLIHIEVEPDVVPVLKQIRAHGSRAGIVLNPDTPLDAILPIMKHVDEVLFMTVHPGFGGQEFIEPVLDKVAALRALFPEMDIALDGGVDRTTILMGWKKGANIFHAGTSLFAVEDIAAEISSIRWELGA